MTTVKKKLKKKYVDKHLLETIYALQWEWKRRDMIVENSVEASDTSLYNRSLAQAKYLFLLREARHRQINAAEYL